MTENKKRTHARLKSPAKSRSTRVAPDTSDRVAPDGVAPGGAASDSVASDSVASDSVASDSVASDSQARLASIDDDQSTTPSLDGHPHKAEDAVKKRRRSSAKPGPKGTYLTEVQRDILGFIAEYQVAHSIAPTHREIRDHFGYSSYGTVYKHLKLLQQKGYLHRDWNQKRGLELLRAVPGVASANENEVPFLGLIAAGQPIEALPGQDHLLVPEQLFGGQPRDHYVLKVVGESMIQEGIHDGDFVVVLRREEARPGEMVVALIGGAEATLKRFYPEGRIVRLQPANATMEPILVPADEVQIQGVVVGLMRRY